VRIRTIALAAGLVAAHTAANAWFFFILPVGGLISAASDKINGVEGAHCVPSTAKPGDVIGLPDGTKWKVISTSGTSDRCINVYQPIRAKLEPVLSGQPGPEQDVCVGIGSKPGDRSHIPGVGQVEVVRLGGSAVCLEPSRTLPVVARTPNSIERFTPPSPNAATTPPVMAPTAPAPEPSPQKPLAERLRDLKQLRDENLITQELYEAKQRDVMNGQ